MEEVKTNLNYVAHFSDYITAFFYVSLFLKHESKISRLQISFALDVQKGAG